eukprot:TRINITY_DN2445_c0_g2_i1.p1 TRINITY_DN2445_c0_g2~~TRINITY_DN2445_c0_g2_i1.p1  ORF type:complete len:113 (-),score=2.71 TRINITY_DN2445_c0_g2_i1:377-715(-)
MHSQTKHRNNHRAWNALPHRLNQLFQATSVQEHINSARSAYRILPEASRHDSEASRSSCSICSGSIASPTLLTMCLHAALSCCCCCKCHTIVYRHLETWCNKGPELKTVENR